MDEYIKSLNEVLNRLSISLRSSVYDVIEKIANIDISIFDKEPLKTICSYNIHYIVITILWGILIYLSLKSVLKLYSDTALNKIYIFILKGIIVTIFSLNSYYICKTIINTNYKITEMLKDTLSEITNSKIEYKFIDDNINSLDELINNKDKLSINGLKDGIVCFYMISLLLLLSFRYVIVISCIIISPIIWMMLLVPRLNNYFYTYIKVFITNLLIQNLNILLLYIPISSKAESNIFLPILLGSIILIYKVNKYAGDTIYERKN